MRQSLDREQKKHIGNLVREHLTKNAIENSRSGRRTLIGSAKELAGEANVTESVIYRLHSGEFSNRTLQLVETVLGVNFRDMAMEASLKINGSAGSPAVSARWEGAHPVRYGGYSREQVAPYLGSYIGIRRSVTYPSHFLGSLFDIYWDDEIGAARFYEDNKFTDTDGRERDYSQPGTLHVSAQIGVIHLLTSEQGALRLITLTRMQIDRVMYGAILTQVSEAGFYRPAKSTIFMRKFDRDGDSEVNELRGPIRPGHKQYDLVVHDLDLADQAIYTR